MTVLKACTHSYLARVIKCVLKKRGSFIMVIKGEMQKPERCL